MPKLSIPNVSASEQFTPASIEGVAGAVASGAAMGDTQRTAGAAATAQGAGIGDIMEQAAKDATERNQQYFNEAQQAIDDSIYNDAMTKARTDYTQQTLDRLNKPYDENGNPTFATLPDDIGKIGEEIRSKYAGSLANPRVAGRFNTDFNTLQANQSIQAMQQARQDMQQFTVGSMYKNITSATDGAIKAGVRGDPVTRDLYFTQGLDALNAGLKNGSISPVEFEQGKEKLRSQVYYGTLKTMNDLDPNGLQQILQTNTPEDLKLNQVEYGNLVQSNLAAVNAYKEQQAKITKEQEQIQLQQFTFNKDEAEVGIKSGQVTSTDVDKMLERGDINHPMWSDLKIKALESEGVSAKKSATIRDITGDINTGRPLTKYSESDINDYYQHTVTLLGKDVTILQKAQIAASAKTPITDFTNEIKGIVRGEKDPNKVAAAVQALDYAAQNNPYAIQSMDKETLGLVSVMATQMKATNQDPARAIDNARKAVMEIDPSVREFRSTHFSAQDKFKPENIEETINKTIQQQTSGVMTNTKIQPDLIPMYDSLFKEAYNITGDQDSAIAMVKQWTQGTVGATAVNTIPGTFKDKETAMLFPPEKVFPQYKPEEIRANINQSVAGLLLDNPHNPTGLTPDQVFIGSDASTRQNLKAPNYLLYFFDSDGNKQILLDKNGLPQHYKLDATERAKIEQAREDRLRAQHEGPSAEGNARQKDFMNQNTTGSTLDKIFMKSQSSTSAYDLAQKYVGLGEIKDNKILSQTMTKMLGQAVDPARTPWCAAFVNSMLQANGIKGTGSLTAVSFLNYGVPTMTPNSGDIVVTHPLAHGATGHVGFFVGYEYTNGHRMVKILAGNTNNAVGYQLLPEGVVRGYRKPPTVSELQTDDTMRGVMKYSQPRGLRNNNPGNLKLTDEQWQGEVKGGDKSFKTFSTPDDGIRGIATSVGKKAARGLNTVADIISSYAPSSENNTGEYIKAVSKAVGVSPNQPLDLNDRDILTKLISGIIKHENGVNPYSESHIKSALASNTVPNIHANNPKVPIRELSPKEIGVIMKENAPPKGDKA